MWQTCYATAAHFLVESATRLHEKDLSANHFSASTGQYVQISKRVIPGFPFCVELASFVRTFGLISRVEENQPWTRTHRNNENLNKWQQHSTIGERKFRRRVGDRVQTSNSLHDVFKWDEKSVNLKCTSFTDLIEYFCLERCVCTLQTDRDRNVIVADDSSAKKSVHLVVALWGKITALSLSYAVILLSHCEYCWPAPQTRSVL